MRSAAERTQETPEDTEARLAAKRLKNTKYRQTAATHLAARKTFDIIAGLQLVDKCDIGSLQSEDGKPQKVCQHCHAMKWKGEPPRTCCSGGSVDLPAFPEHPQAIQQLWEGQAGQAKLLKKHSRTLNNALALACMQTKTPDVPGGGWTPSVVIQGRVFVGMGPLKPSDEAGAVYSQLYVLDLDKSDSEAELRFNNMSLPASTPASEKHRLQELLSFLQSELRQCNNYIQDFMSAAEIVAAECPPSLRVVIEEKKIPEGDHPRRYNKGFNEISVIVDDEKPGERSFIVNLRGPGRAVREIQDFHRSADPLHYILLFPLGTDGWNLTLNVSPLQFYCYHIQVRWDSDLQRPATLTIHWAGRLFQEYICTSYAKVENQRLKFISHN